MLSGTNRKNGFIDNKIEPVWWVNLKGTKSDKLEEKDRKEFVESTNYRMCS